MAAPQSKCVLVEREVRDGMQVRLQKFISEREVESDNELLKSVHRVDEADAQELLITRVERGLSIGSVKLGDQVLLNVVDDIDIAEECTKLKEEQQLWLQTLNSDAKGGAKSSWRRIIQKRHHEIPTVVPEQQEESVNEDPINHLRTAVETVQQAQHKWKGQKRLKDGRVQGRFHKLLKSLDGYSSVLSILPNNEYTSVLCGAIKVLVKAAANHVRVAEHLDDALDEIHVHMSLCRRMIRDPPSVTAQKALNLFMARIFRYLRCAYRWFNSRSRKKVLDSANANVYEDLKIYLDNIVKAANIFQHASFEQRAAESEQNEREVLTRLGRLEVVHIEEAERKKIEAEHAKAEQLEDMAEIRTLRLEFERELKLGIAVRKLLETSLRAGLHEPIQQCAHNKRALKEPKGSDTHLRRSSIKFYNKEQLQIRSRHLEDYTSDSISMLYSVDPEHLYADFNVVDAIQRWSHAAESQILWVKGPYEEQYPSSASAVAAKVISVALKLKIPTLFFFCSVDDDPCDTESYELRFQLALIDCVYSLIRQLIDVLAPQVADAGTGTRKLGKQRFAQLDGSFESLSDALDILNDLFLLAPRTLVIVIDGLDQIWGRGIDEVLLDLIQLLEDVLVRGSERRAKDYRIFKVLFTSTGPCDALNTIATENLDIVLASEPTPKHLVNRDRLLGESHLIDDGTSEMVESEESSSDDSDGEE